MCKTKKEFKIRASLLWGLPVNPSIAMEQSITIRRHCVHSQCYSSTTDSLHWEILGWVWPLLAWVLQLFGNCSNFMKVDYYQSWSTCIGSRSEIWQGLGLVAGTKICLSENRSSPLSIVTFMYMYVICVFSRSEVFAQRSLLKFAALNI